MSKGEGVSVRPTDARGAQGSFDARPTAQPVGEVTSFPSPQPRGSESESSSQSVSRFPAAPRAGRLATGLTAMGIAAASCGTSIDNIREQDQTAFDQKFTAVCQVDVPKGHTGEQIAIAHQAPGDIRERKLFEQEVERMNPNSDGVSSDGPRPDDARNHVVLFPCEPPSPDQVPPVVSPPPNS